MAKIIPDKTWPDSEVFIIGGGKSLESFDWSLLRSELTIGCNDAFLLGEEVCSVAVFGDHAWWLKHKAKLEMFKGRIFTNCNQLQTSEVPWLSVMSRFQWGLSKEHLGWNSNTGAAAIHLALLLGAKKVYLLGFDCHLTNGENNWHPNELDAPNAELFPRFMEGFERLKRDMPKVFPNSEIINVSDVSSLEVFKKVELTGFFERRQK